MVWLLLALLLTGCSSGPRGQLRVATGDSGAALQPHLELARSFPHPVRIEPIAGGDYYTRLLTQLASGDPPDLIHVGEEMVGFFVSRETLLPLQSVDESVYLPQVHEPGRFGGELVLLPKDYTTLAVLCNRKILKRLNLSEPSPDWTWGDFREICLRARAGGVWGAILPGPRSGFVEVLIEAFGGHLFEESAEAFEALRFLQELYHGSQVCPLPLELGSYDGGRLEFERGRCLFQVTGHWPVERLRSAGMDLLVLPLPRARKRANRLHWSGFGVARASRNRVLARAYLEHATGRAGSEVWRHWGLPALHGVPLRADEQVWVDGLRDVFVAAHQKDPSWFGSGQPAMVDLHETVLVVPEADLVEAARRFAAEAERRSDAVR